MLVPVSDLDLTRYINETNRSVKHLADVLFEKTGNGSWVVVFKALITVHHLMVYGNEVSMAYSHMVVISFLLIQKTVSRQLQSVLGLAKVYHLLLKIVTHGRSE